MLVINPTASIIIIGNEILSGRTLDINTQYIAKTLSQHGIDLIEVRIIADDHAYIVSTVSEIKQKYDYIFITGGIGPTHDDITSQAIADVFNLPLEINQKAYNTIKAFYESQGKGLNAAREKMAYLPHSSALIDNPVSWAPGFIIENVFVMAGVPHIMQAMFDHLLPTLRKGQPTHTKNIDIMVGESTIAAEFAALQTKYPEVQMGSYPFTIEQKHGSSLVLRSQDTKKLEQAYSELEAFVKEKFASALVS